MPRDTTLGKLEPLGGGDPIPLVKEHLVLGRRESCDVCLRFPNVSGRHCELILEHGYWKVRDLQSANGTKVNGEKVLEKRMYPGDELSIAKLRYRLDYTPTTARSVDAEVDELHENIKQFSLMERAGLVKKKEPDKGKAAKPRDIDKEAALDVVRALTHKPIPAAPVSGSDVPPAAPLSDEHEVEDLTREAEELSDDEFLKIVRDEKDRKSSR